MKIKAFHAINFKGLKDVEIPAPDPALVIVTGRNGAGKTSVIDAVESALGGAASSPGVPVRRGAPRAAVVVDLGDVVVTRRWDAAGKTSLSVENPDGTRARSPQALLDSLYRRATFDPVAFSRQDAKAQAKTLRTLAGLDGPFARLDAQAQALRDERADANRAARDLEGEYRRFPAAESFEGVPDAEESVADLSAEHAEAVEEKARNDAIRYDVRTARRAADRAGEDREQAERAVRELTERLRAAEARLAETTLECARAAETLAWAEAEAQGLADPDVESIRTRMRDAESVNAKVRTKRRRAEAMAKWEEAREKADGLTEALRTLDAERSALLSEARYPVTGLDVRDDVVLLGGVPLDQANSAARIRVGLAVGAALNPGLKVALVRDGSLLDEDALAELTRWAEAEGMQVWLERVGGRESPEGIIIEEGRVYRDNGRRRSDITAPGSDLFDAVRDNDPV